MQPETGGGENGYQINREKKLWTVLPIIYRDWSTGSDVHYADQPMLMEKGRSGGRSEARSFDGWMLGLVVGSLYLYRDYCVL